MPRKRRKKTTDLSLLFRLRYMGYCLLLFAVAFFLYALQVPENSPSFPPEIPEEELSGLIDPEPHETFNFFAVSFLFASLGTACILTSRKKLRTTKKRKR